jgi:membrane protein DedA with SNARE-associated domain
VAGVWLPGSIFLGTFITEDLSCVAAGVFAADGHIDYVTAIIACSLGIWLGDIGLYLIGWLTTRGLLRWGWAKRRLQGRDNSAWRQAFERRGAKILFASRFLPGTRVPSYLAAGAIGWPLWRFAGVLGLAVVIWTPLLVGAAALSGKIVLDWLAAWGVYAWFAAPIALLVAWCVLRFVSDLCSWRGRRLLLGRLYRWMRWEYWPPVLVFPPVVLDQLRIALVHRTPLVLSACNRGIPFGGLFGESKGDILDLFPAASGDGVFVARYQRLLRSSSLDERMAHVRAFMNADGAVARCVLKPDQGERGTGVVVIQDEDAARQWLQACPYDAIVQEFIAGEEFGVAWCRDPKTGRGQIHSIAHKVLPSLCGDGVNTLEALILKDERTLPMARLHLQAHASRLASIPASGERVSLGDLGTHARGATFFDARELASPELHQAFEQFLANVPGVDFGRFDVRAPSKQHLQAGHAIAVLEFNGVTGEAAHVYQPGYPWYRGVGDMIQHMRRASVIGAHNRRAGHAPATLRQLWGVFRAARSRPKFALQATDPIATEHAPAKPVSRALAQEGPEA